MFELRPQQNDACKAAYTELKSGTDATLLVMATGFGKTIVASALTNRFVNENETVLFVAHRDELIRQAAEKFWKARMVKSSIEKADEYASLDSPVVIASVQSLQGDRLRRWPRGHFDKIIIDEAHRSVSQTYLNVFDHFIDRQLLGLTATAFRAKGSLGDVYSNICYEHNLRQSIQDGLLAPIVAQVLPLKIDMHSLSNSGSDYDANEIADSIDPFLHKIAEAMAGVALGRKTLVFTPTRETARKCAEIFGEYGFNTYYAGGDDRSQIAAYEADGAGSIMFTAQLLIEGYDHAQIDCIADLTPTKSTGRYMQKIGRGTRLFIGKENCLVLDFLWNFANNDICKPSCLIAETEEEAKAIDDILDKKGSPVDLLNEAEPAALSNIQNVRERKLAERLQNCSNRNAKEFDPVIESLAIFDNSIPSYEPSFEWEKEPVTNAQRQMLEANGFKPDGWVKGFATKIIDGVMKRSRENLCSPRQMRCLMRNGTTDAIMMTKSDASRAMDKTSAKWEKAKRYKRYKEMRRER